MLESGPHPFNRVVSLSCSLPLYPFPLSSLPSAAHYVQAEEGEQGKSRQASPGKGGVNRLRLHEERTFLPTTPSPTPAPTSLSNTHPHQSNRPWSANNVVDSLQKDGVKKAATDRALASLVSKGLIHKKEYGKANIFIVSQEGIDLPDADAAAAVDEETRALTARSADLDDSIAGLRGRSAQLGATLSLDEARAEVGRLDAIVAKREAKTAELGDASKLMTSEEKAEVEKAYFVYLSAWKKRKRMVKNVADAIGESSGMKPSQFYEKVGVEDDDAAGVSLDHFPQIDDPTKVKKAAGRRPVKKQKR